MTLRAELPHSRRDFHTAHGVLLVVRDPPPPAPPAKGQPAAVPANRDEGVEILLAVWDDGSVTGLNGHVDLGTGIRTALGQIAAEELDLPIERLHMRLGDTASVPNQGATIASASIQIHAAPLRHAAAQARAWLLHAASNTLHVEESQLSLADGVFTVKDDLDRHITFGDLVAGKHVEIHISGQAPLKSADDYRIVGTSSPRVDIPGKVAGDLVFVHDMRVPGMLHGRVVRPPYAGVDAGDFVGNTLESVDESSIVHIAGIRAVVVIRDFVGIVAEREEQADQAMRELKVNWRPWPGIRGLDDLEDAVRNNPSTRRLLAEQGDVTAAIANAAVPMSRSYVWPYQLHASIGPSCALADWSAERLTVWAGTQNPHVLRADLGKLMQMPDLAVNVIRMEAAGCYGRNGADDVAADAALLSRAVCAPVRVQLTREQENAWDPKGTAQLMQVEGGLNADGSVAAYDFQTSYPSNGAPMLALLLTGAMPAVGMAYEMGDRTAVPPYEYENLRVVANDMAPILRASWLRGVSALPNSFAHESYVDELATQAGADPLDFRLDRLKDVRAAELLRSTADRAGWLPHTGPQQQPPDGDWLKGQGVAYARYIHSKFPGFGAAWAAWVADVEVNQQTGEVHVSRVVVGHDAGMMVNPAGVQYQVHGNVLQTTSRALKEQVKVDERGVTQSLEWGAYPILSFREVPVVEVMMMPRQAEPPLGAGESASVPGTAAIANAIFDATGVRFRQPPFTAEVVKAGMREKAEADGRARVGSSASADVGPGSVTVLPPGAGATQAAMTERLTMGVGDSGVPFARVDAASGASPESSVLAEDAGHGMSAATRWLPEDAVLPRRKPWWSLAGALVAGVVGLGAGLLGAKSAIAPITAGSASVYTAETIERGRLLAATGDCVVCHTAPGGSPNAGGRAMTTPFGTIYTTNLTPDAATGIGTWSFTAFQRAMREGISRDGHHLYPAFPYTSFTRTTDEDLTALYAYLMAQPAVEAGVPETTLAFPFNVRPLMAMWNAVNLTVGPQPAMADQTAEWNRGAYLVNGLGHCGACHTPRDATQGEAAGKAYLAGAMVDGWEAPALTALGQSPVPWTQAELYRYLRFGHSAEHGVASGPMAAVVQQLATIPEADVEAMAVYLASFNARSAGEAVAEAGAAGEPELQAKGSAVAVSRTGAGLSVAATQAIARSEASSATLRDASQRMFDSACGACHHDGAGPKLLGLNIPLALNSNLHGTRPDNLVRIILEGIRTPPSADVGFMPAFKDSLSDQQIADLAAHMRQRFAPDKPAWAMSKDEVARIRAASNASTH